MTAHEEFPLVEQRSDPRDEETVKRPQNSKAVPIGGQECLSRSDDDEIVGTDAWIQMGIERQETTIEVPLFRMVSELIVHLPRKASDEIVELQKNRPI